MQPSSDAVQAADPGAFAARFRREILDTVNGVLIEKFGADERFSGIFEGGSTAMGRADEWSDIDFCIVSDPALNDVMFATVEDALARVRPIVHTWRVAEPGWGPGFAQRFYLLQDAPPFFFIDCSVLAPATAATFLERERHGEAVVYHDRNGALVPKPLDRTSFSARLRRRYEQIQACWPIYLTLVRKELARGRALDAHAFYATTLRFLVELVGMRYRPERFDFGWRYLHHDVPADVQQALQQWLYVAGPDHISTHLPAIDAMARRLVGEIAARPSILADAALPR